MKKKLVIIICVALLIMLSVIIKGSRSKKTVPVFRTEKTSIGDVVSTVTATGSINPVTTVEVGTQVSGTIKQIFVDYNSSVKKGQIIAQIDPSTLEAQVEQSKANLAQVKASETKTAASLADAERTLRRTKELFGRDLIARSELDTAETNYELAAASLESAKAQVTQAEASLKYAETNLGYAKIISPVDGIVISRDIDVGQTVAASFSTPTLFTIAQDLTKMQINASVDEADIAQIMAGQSVEFTADAYPEDVFSGKVKQVRNAATIVSNVVTYDVVIGVENPDMKLKPGMTANVSFIVSSRKNVLRVPDAAMTFNISADKSNSESNSGHGDAGSNVWILKNGKPERIIVTKGESNGTFTEITAGQLKEGDIVITGYASGETESNSSSNRQSMGPPPMF
jgi:HlyD family secretion protein